MVKAIKINMLHQYSNLEMKNLIEEIKVVITKDKKRRKGDLGRCSYCGEKFTDGDVFSTNSMTGWVQYSHCGIK